MNTAKLEKTVTQTILANLRDEFIETGAKYLVLEGHTLEDAEKTLIDNLPEDLRAPKDYRIQIYDNRTGGILDRSEPLPNDAKDALLLLECRRYMEKRKGSLDNDCLKEFESICKKMDSKE